MVAGGLFYTVGTVIYASDRPHLWPGRFSAHDLWHVFVLAGSTAHYVLILLFVAR
jgi:hemolysin III